MILRRVGNDSFFYPQEFSGLLLPKPDHPLYDELLPLCQGAKVHLVDVSVKKSPGDIKVFLVLWAPENFGIDECARVHRLILPRLEVFFDTQDVSAEVSSPGLGRIFKYQTELEIFTGRPVKIWFTGDPDWREGILGPVVASEISVKTAKGEIKFPLSSVVRAKLNDL